MIYMYNSISYRYTCLILLRWNRFTSENFLFGTQMAAAQAPAMPQHPDSCHQVAKMAFSVVITITESGNVVKGLSDRLDSEIDGRFGRLVERVSGIYHALWYPLIYNQLRLWPYPPGGLPDTIFLPYVQLRVDVHVRSLQDIEDFTMDQPPVPLTVLRLNSKFDKIWSVLVENMLNRSQWYLYTSRQLHCRDVCKISLWLVEHNLNHSTSNLGLIANSIEMSLVGRGPGSLRTGVMDKSVVCTDGI